MVHELRNNGTHYLSYNTLNYNKKGVADAINTTLKVV